MNAKHPVEGVRDEIVCPKCGRYDTDMGATVDEHELLLAAMRQGGTFSVHAIYCSCFENMTTDGECPHCNKFIRDLWDYGIKGSGSLIECPHCEAPIWAEPVTEFHLQAKRPRQWGGKE